MDEGGGQMTTNVDQATSPEAEAILALIADISAMAERGGMDGQSVGWGLTVGLQIGIEAGKIDAGWADALAEALSGQLERLKSGAATEFRLYAFQLILELIHRTEPSPEGRR